MSGIDLTGQKFGRLTVLSQHPEKTSNGGYQWQSVCDCGSSKVVSSDNLRRGLVKSCGCLHRESASDTGKSNLKHGGSDTAEYDIWDGMKRRCLNPEHPSYPDYGARGISVCSRWKESFEAFREDMGNRPFDGASIERIKNDGNYEPGNCKWATTKEQSNNRRSNHIVTVDDITATVTQHAERLQIPPTTVMTRLRRNWSIEEAFKRPVQTKRK